MWSLLPHASCLIGELKMVVECKKYILITGHGVIVIADFEHFALKESICRRGLPCPFRSSASLNCLVSKVSLGLHICICFSTDPCSFVRMMLQSQWGL